MSVLDDESLRSKFLENTRDGVLIKNHWFDYGQHFVDISIIWEIAANGDVPTEVFPEISK